jgi:integrase
VPDDQAPGAGPSASARAERGRGPRRLALFRIRLLTAQRGSEVHGASWDEMDLTTGWWTIPGERSKNGLDHRVPLSPQASRILKDLRNITDKSKSNSNSKWVFPSTRKTGPHINHAQKAIERIEKRSAVEFRNHDLRRTAFDTTSRGTPAPTMRLDARRAHRVPHRRFEPTIRCVGRKGTRSFRTRDEPKRRSAW